MNERVAFARRLQGGLVGAAALLAAPWYGWWLAGLVAIALSVLVGTDLAGRASARPERVSAAAFAALEALVAVAVAGTGGARSPMLSILALPVVMIATRFRARVVAVGVAGALGLTAAALAVAPVLRPAPTVPSVIPVASFVALLAGLVVAAVTLLAAELQSRGEATVDPLTALFNRKALRDRFAEAAAQAAVLGWPLALIVCDIDHFKRVNDVYGHDRGDAVLRAVAQRMRNSVRSTELLYRTGGEEFLILLPGQDTVAAARIAVRLVADIESAPLAGLRITISAGVASHAAGGVSFETLVGAADEALYEAKRAGRNQVCCADDAEQYEAS